VGETSEALMLAEVSTMKMNRLPSSSVPFQPGRTSVKINSAMRSNCRRRSRLFRNFCQRELTCRSSMARLHRYVLGTCNGCRRSFKKYSAIIAGGTSSSRPHWLSVSVFRK
jgi:hypothetical protein